MHLTSNRRGKSFLFFAWICSVIIGIWWFTWKQAFQKENMTDPIEHLIDNSCTPWVSREYIVRWNSMSPIIEDGSTLEWIYDYYACPWNIPKRWDIIILEDSATKWPYVKMIWAVPWDHIGYTASGNLIINDRIFTNSNGVPYFFTQSELNFLNLYVHNDILQNDAYFVFGENTINSRDSRKIWALSKSAFKAKITKINGTPIDNQ
jgi:signal peptidase I